MLAVEDSNREKMQSRVRGMEGARMCRCGLQFLNKMMLEGFLEEVMFGQRHGNLEVLTMCVSGKRMS